MRTNRLRTQYFKIPGYLILCLCTLSQGSLLHAASSPDDGGPDRCPVPKILNVHNVNTGSADIVWSASDSVFTTDLQWRVEGAIDWTTIPDIQSPYTLSGLAACETYEIRLLGHCDGIDSEPGMPWTFEADGCCRIPTGLRLVTSSDVSAVIAWDSVTFAFAHHVRYRELGTDEWSELEVETNLAGLQDLMPCTAYEVQAGSQCDLDSTGYSASLIFQTMECGGCTEIQYCPSMADDASTEWIDSVSFGAIRLKSGSNQGYLLRNTIETGIERKRPYTFHVSPGTVFAGSTFYLRMWIDLDQDGVFADSSELLVDPADPVDITGWTGELIIPDTVALGSTRMRIALKAILGQDTLRPEACGTFLFGEVEDYCISIDDLCPEIEPELLSVSETSATIAWTPIDEAIVVVYQYKKVSDASFGEPELTEDSIILISDLEKCTDYVLQALSVCVQDTSSVEQFFFTTECPDAVNEIVDFAEQLKVYPNPFSDRLIVSMIPSVSGEAVISLYNLMGTELNRIKIGLHPDQEVLVRLDDLERLTSGIYLVSVEVAGRRQVLKVVK